jgi:small subunit ribosomal protein S4e
MVRFEQTPTTLPATKVQTLSYNPSFHDLSVLTCGVDVITIDKTNEHFRLVYDVKGRFTIHRITAEEAKYKLGKVKRVQLGAKGVPYLVTHDARTIRYPDPAIKVGDTIRYDLEAGKITGYIKFDIGNIAMITAGNNIGRVGVVTHRERHHGGYDIVHIKDAADHTFATREGNVFIIGEGNKPWISLPKGRGVRLSIAEGTFNPLFCFRLTGLERDARRKAVGLTGPVV